MRVSSLPAPRRTRRELRSTRNLKKLRTLLSRLKRAWLSTQVSHRGKYSIERLLAFQEYTQRTSRTRVFLVCVGTPIPMIIFVLALECVPLQEPNAGWKKNYGLWIRSAVICGVIASTMLVELKNLVEGVTMSIRQVLFVLICVMIGDTALCMAVAAYLAFPIPFHSIIMVPPLLVIVAVSLRVAFGASGFNSMLEHPAQMFGFVLFIFAQALTLLIYPVYQVLFDAVVNTRYELSVMMLLPLVKLITKNIVASSIDHMEDMIPETVIFTVDFFNTIYVATCMQRTSSTTTILTIMIFDALHTLLALRSLYRTAIEIHRRLSNDMAIDRPRLLLLDVGCSLCQFRDTFERQELSQIHLRSCLPHELSSAGRGFLGRLDKYPLKAPVKAHRRRIASALLLQNAGNSTQTNSQNVGWKNAKRFTTKIHAMSVLHVVPKPLLRDSAFRTHSAISSCCVPPSRILQRTLEILFTTECMILTEYLESFIPCFYAGFLCLMIRLPSAQYHTELAGLTTENVQDTVQIVFLYGMLECFSFVALILVLRRTIGTHALYHLAFVLETQTALIQSKLIVWMLLTLTCRVIHYASSSLGSEPSEENVQNSNLIMARAWRYVTFDATGTLLRPAESPGVTYLRFWETTAGQSFSSSRRSALGAALTSHFPLEFSLQSRRHPNFGADGVRLNAYPWWHELIVNVMKHEVPVAHSEQTERFTRDLYAHFSRPEAWQVFDDVRPTLETLSQKDVRMGVISNFDERLEPLLVALELRSFFEVVTASFTQPQMKPHASIFQSTFQILQGQKVDASSCLHVGDHVTKDYKAAKAWGAQAKLVMRTEGQTPSDVEETDVIETRDFEGTCVAIARELAACDDPSHWLDLLRVLVVRRSERVGLSAALAERLEMDFLPQVVQLLLGKSFELSAVENVNNNDGSLNQEKQTSGTLQFAARDSSEYTSRYFLRNLEFWGKLGGFSVLLDVLQAGASFEALQCILRTLYDAKDHLKPEFLIVYFPKLIDAVCTLIRKLQSSEFYALSRDSLLEVVQVMELVLVKIQHDVDVSDAMSKEGKMSDDVTAGEVCEQRVQLLRLEISLRFFQSSSLEKRIYGVTEIVVIITRLYNDQIQEQAEPTAASLYATLSYLVDWMHEKQLMQELLGEKMHVELVKRSTSLFQFASELEVLPTAWIDLAWGCYHADSEEEESQPIQRRHEACRSTIHDLLLEMVTFMELPSLIHLVRRIEAVKAKIDSNQLGLLAAIAARRLITDVLPDVPDDRNLTSSSDNVRQRSLRQRILLHLWLVVLPSAKSDDLRDEILLRMHDMLRLEAADDDGGEQAEASRITKECAMVDEFVGLCLDNISRRENLVISLKLFTQLSSLVVEVGVVISDQRSQSYVEMLLSETVKYKQNVREALKASEWRQLDDDKRVKLPMLKNHVNEIKNRLLALRAAWILDQCGVNKEASFTEVQLNNLWELMIVNAFLEDEAALCFQWIELCMNTPLQTRTKTPENESRSSPRALMPLCIAEYLLTTKFSSLPGDCITLSTLCCFHSIFRRINILKGGLEIFTTVPGDSSRISSPTGKASSVGSLEGDKEESVELMTNKPLVGMDELWQLAVRATDPAVAEEIITLLASFHLAFAPNVRQTEFPFQCKMKFLEKCMEFIAAAKTDAEMVQTRILPPASDQTDETKLATDVAVVNRCVDLLRYFLEACKVGDNSGANVDEEVVTQKLENEVTSSTIVTSAEDTGTRRKAYRLDHLEERLPYLEIYPSPMKDTQTDSDGGSTIGYRSGRRPSWTFRQQHALLDVIIDTNEETEIEDNDPVNCSSDTVNSPLKITIKTDLLSTGSPIKPSTRSPCVRADLRGPQAPSPQRGPNFRPEDIDQALTDFTSGSHELKQNLQENAHKFDKPKTKFGILSQILANQGPHFDVLLELVDWNEATSQRTWDLLCRLPTNNELLRKMIHLRHLDKDQDTPGDVEWSKLLDGSNVHRLLYALRLVESLLIPIEPSRTGDQELNSGRRQWRERFVRLGGARHLYETLLAWPMEHSSNISGTEASISSQYAQNIRATCLAAVMRVLHYFFYWSNRTTSEKTEQEKLSPFDFRLQSLTLPEFVKSIELSSLLRVAVQLTGNFCSRSSHTDVSLSEETAEAIYCGVQMCCSLIHFAPHVTAVVFEEHLDIETSFRDMNENGITMTGWLKALLVDCPSKQTRAQVLGALSEMATGFGIMHSYSSARGLFELLVVSACYLVSDSYLGETYKYSVLEELFMFCHDIRGHQLRVLETVNLAGRQWNYAPADSFMDSSKSNHHAGLVNPGCICYMNSLVQQLFMMPQFCGGLLALDCSKIPVDRSSSAWKEEIEQLQKLFASLAYTNYRSSDPTAFAHSHKDMDGNSTDVHIQMDADEFFSLLLDRLEMFIRSKTKPEPTGENSKCDNVDDFMARSFGGVLVNQILTQQGNLSEREEKFFALSLEVSKKRHLAESLELYVQGERLEGENAYFCERAQRKVSATKRVCIKKLPQTLVCHLKRFEFDYDTMEKMKINDFLEFPMEIDMFPYTSEALAAANNAGKTDKSILYDLVGVVVHSGTSDTGHYYSFIKDRHEPQNQRWLEFNDEIVRDFDAETMGEECFGGEEVAQKWDALQGTYAPIVQMKRRSAYMLIYERRSAEQNTSLGTITLSSKVQALATQIMQENARYEGVVNCFDPTYEQFIRDLVESATRLSTDFDPAVARQACQIGCRFLFGINTLRSQSSPSSPAPLHNASSTIVSSPYTICVHVALWLSGYGKSSSCDVDDERVQFSKWILAEVVAPPTTSLATAVTRVESQRTWLFDMLFLSSGGQQLIDSCSQLLLAAINVLAHEATAKTVEAEESLVTFFRDALNLFYSREPHLDLCDPSSGCVLTLSVESRVPAMKQLGIFLEKCISGSSTKEKVSMELCTIRNLFLKKLQFLNHFLLTLQTPCELSDVTKMNPASRGIAPLAIETRTRTPLREHDLRLCTFQLEIKLLKSLLESYDQPTHPPLDTTLLLSHSALKNVVLFGLEDTILPILTRILFESEALSSKCDRLVALLIGVLEEVKDTHAEKVLAVFGRLLNEEEERAKLLKEGSEASNVTWTVHRHVFSPTRGILESVTYYRDHGSHKYTLLLLEFVVRRASESSVLQELFRCDHKFRSTASWIPKWLVDHLDSNGAIRDQMRVNSGSGHGIEGSTGKTEDMEVQKLFIEVEKAFGVTIPVHRDDVTPSNEEEQGVSISPALSPSAIAAEDVLLEALDEENQHDYRLAKHAIGGTRRIGKGTTDEFGPEHEGGQGETQPVDWKLHRSREDLSMLLRIDLDTTHNNAREA
ncbi:Ubiquitin-specific protease [Phytophthora megakarya]|uniref:ubiquitinyl hydrolase 1 n=1 Tax=Phytophthora megakarya TaxID=4795 RepID=A0A225WP09_9STRA|nr:Ubiquitin-specific protease [Phytophthora megakarya]